MKYIVIILSLVSLSLGIFFSEDIAALSANRAVVERTQCIGCNICVEACPTKAIRLVNGKAIVNPEKCVGCTICVTRCPQKTISMELRNSDEDVR